MSIYGLIDDKYIPFYRIMWIAKTPHFCGDEECSREGYYEIRLEQDESVWANADERDKLLVELEQWQMGLTEDDGEPPGES